MRRRLNRAHVARVGEREVKRARNRRGAEREHVHQGPQALELFLVQDAEALLLVNHTNLVFKPNVTLNQPMRADDDVHRAVGQILHDTFLLPPRSETESNSMRIG